MLQTILMIIGGFVLLRAIIGVLYKKTSGICDCPDRLDGKTVIITGASAGIGKSAAFDLAKRGPRIILACRNVSKAQAVADEIIKESGNKDIVVREIDTSDLESVRNFASLIIKEEKRLDILINNAGVSLGEHQKSKQGFELTYATNHLGHFLLTNLLLGLLKANEPSRIINVSSEAHMIPGFDIEDLNFVNRSYSRWKSYGQSKLCNILFTKELANKLQGTNITVNALHPGVVDSEFITKENTSLGKVISFLFSSTIKTTVMGAQTTIHVAVSKKVENVTGEYFCDCKIIKSSNKSKDMGLAKKLWEISEKDAKLQPHELFF